MSRFVDVVYHHDDDTVDIGAGCVFREVYDSLPRARNIVGPYATQRTGVSGWLLGGGYSPKTNKYGLGIDNVVAVQIVVPNDNGKVALKTVTKDDDEELFWAIKVSHNIPYIDRFLTALSQTGRGEQLWDCHQVYFEYSPAGQSLRQKFTDCVVWCSNADFVHIGWRPCLYTDSRISKGQSCHH